MRLGAVSLACGLKLAASCVAVPLAFAAPPAASQPAAPDAATLEARRHFKNGVELYRDANYAGALVEFEAAYREKPGPGSLQNVALCQKALYRYAEAVDSLRLLLERHAGELSEQEATAVRLARAELEALVGRIVLRLRPPHAKLTLDGRPLSVASLGVPLRVNVGEHTLVADAPGFARVSQTIRVSGGSDEQVVELTLEPVMAFVDVVASDAGAVIAIDGRPVGLGHWTGPVSPAEEHLIQVYRAGFEPFEARVRGERGQTLAVAAKLGPRIEGAPSAPPPDSRSLPPPPGVKTELGWYSAVGLNLLGTGATPFGDFDVAGARSKSSALSLGVSVGRRLWTTLGAEMLIELGAHRVKSACDEALTAAAETTCGASDQVSRNYSLGWARFGPVIRLSTPGERVRASGGFGAGLVWHELRVDRTSFATGGRERGVDPYALIEIGASYHFGRLSLGLALMATVDGARGLDGEFDGEEQRAFDTTGGTLPLVGIGFRAGYSQWAAPKRTK